jgi:uncharacterized protein with HEPN domain
MQRDKEYLLDILEAAKLAQKYVASKTKSAFLRDTLCQDAVIRRIEIIGEVAGRISEETKDSFPLLPWSEMIGMRNIMIHDYDDVDIAIVWETVQNDLPTLISTLNKYLSSEDND